MNIHHSRFCDQSFEFIRSRFSNRFLRALIVRPKYAYVTYTKSGKRTTSTTFFISLLCPFVSARLSNIYLFILFICYALEMGQIHGRRYLWKNFNLLERIIVQLLSSSLFYVFNWWKCNRILWFGTLFVPKWIDGFNRLRWPISNLENERGRKIKLKRNV